MELSVETFLKPTPQASSETVGQARLSLNESVYQQLTDLEQTLKNSASKEVTIAASEHDIDIDSPSDVGALKDKKVRVFLDRENQAGHFHLVAKRSSDEALVYTEPAMIRLVAA